MGFYRKDPLFKDVDGAPLLVSEMRPEPRDFASHEKRLMRLKMNSMQLSACDGGFDSL